MVRSDARVLGLPKRGGHDEAVLLFTSGSSGEPKGVVLSHRNILANISQFRLMVNLQPDDAVLASLPFFHTFGCTVTLWFPIIEGLRAVTYPNPLDVAKNAELVQRYACSMLLATPTFLRSYLRKVDKEQLASLRLLITGAEKLPRTIADAVLERFDKQVLEGYGLTETAPVLSCNLPDVSLNDAGHTVQHAYRAGSVGKLAPGIAAQIRHPDTGEHLSLHDTGMLWVRGANIFEGYLGEPALTADVLQDGWFRTGDLGRFDEDGFPLHRRPALALLQDCGRNGAARNRRDQNLRGPVPAARRKRLFMVTGVPDEAKGEALVLLSTVDIVQSRPCAPSSPRSAWPTSGCRARSSGWTLSPCSAPANSTCKAARTWRWQKINAGETPTLFPSPLHFSSVSSLRTSCFSLRPSALKFRPPFTERRSRFPHWSVDFARQPAATKA